MDVKITILQVEVANLRPNPWNTNSVGAQNFEKLKGSIEKLGFFKPILARELDGGVFEILGGEHRRRAAMEQGISTVPVISVGKINDLVAKQMSLVDNERYGEDDQVALQRLIEEIQSEIDYRLSDIAPYDDEMAATLAKASVLFQPCSCSLRRVAIRAAGRPSNDVLDAQSQHRPSARGRGCPQPASRSRCPGRWRGREGVHGGFATQDWKTSRNR